MIEKLGMPAYDFRGLAKVHPATFNAQTVKELQDQRDVMLEALIDYQKDENTVDGRFLRGSRVIALIEKATGKTWQEVKEVLNAE